MRIRLIQFNTFYLYSAFKKYKNKQTKGHCRTQLTISLIIFFLLLNIYYLKSVSISISISVTKILTFYSIFDVC